MKARLEKARIEWLSCLSCSLQHLTHVNIPEVTRSVVDIINVAEEFVCLYLVKVKDQLIKGQLLEFTGL